LADLPLDAVYSSPLRRAADTCRHLLSSHGQAIEPQLSDRLLEIDLEPWSGLRRDELRQRFPQQEALWRQAPHTLELERADGRRYNPLAELLAQAGSFR
jgi:probable phosphoglycerate mutase